MDAGPDLSRIPPQVLGSLKNADTLTAGDRMILQAYLQDPSADPAVSEMIRELLGISAPPVTPAQPSMESQLQAQIDQPTGQALPGVPERQGTPLGAPGETWAERAISGTMSGAAGRIAEGFGLATPRPLTDNAPGPAATPAAGLPDAPPSLPTPTPPNVGAIADPQVGPFGTPAPSSAGTGGGLRMGAFGPLAEGEIDQSPIPADWKQTRDAELTGLDPTSVFATIPSEDWGKFAMLTAYPELAAQTLYGGSSTAGAMAAPTVAALMQAANLGLLGGVAGGDLTSAQEMSDTQQLKIVEDLKTQMTGVPGAQISPGGIYREAFSRALATDPMEMYTGEGVAGDVQNQIAITNAALSAAAPFITKGQQQYFINKLDAMAMRYMSAYTSGEIDVEEISYPEFLRQNGAEEWLGGGG